MPAKFVRSKGCFNCRRRKKGCDHKRPTCGQCTKGRLRCEGYGSSLAIITCQSQASGVSKSLIRRADQDQFIELFWDLHLPSSTNSPSFVHQDWSSVIRDRYNSDSGMRNALLAVCHSRIGQLRNDEYLIQAGSEYYGACLQNMITAIDRGSVNDCDDLIGMCLLLSQYEILCSTISPALNWQHHADGMSQLIQTRRPDEYMLAPSHQLLTSARLNIVFNAIVSRKATFLSSPEWLQIPWRLNKKTLYDKILDVATEVPAMLEMFDHILISTPQNNDSWYPLINLCWHLDRALQYWRIEFTSYHSSSTSIDLDSPLELRTCMENIDPDTAKAISIYWMICIFLYATMRIVWQMTDSPECLLPPRTHPYRYAKLISESVSYLSSPLAGESSTACFSMSIGLAIHYFAITGDLFSEAGLQLSSSFIGGSIGGIGTRIGRFMRDLQCDPARLRIDTVSDDRTAIIETAQKWWGGGRMSITLASKR